MLGNKELNVSLGLQRSTGSRAIAALKLLIVNPYLRFIAALRFKVFCSKSDVQSALGSMADGPLETYATTPGSGTFERGGGERNRNS